MIPLFWSFKVSSIYSENTLYHPNSAVSKSGKRYHFLYKDPQIAEYQQTIIENLEFIIKPDKVPLPENVFGFINEFRLEFPKTRYWDLDITNCIKSLEDAYMRFFKKIGREFDDSQVIANIEVKLPSSEEKNTISCTTLFLDSPDEIDFLYRVPFLKSYYLK